MELDISKIYSFKMNSGEEIVATIVEKIYDDPFPHLLLEAPLAAAATQQGIQLYPAMFSNDLNGNAMMYMSSIALVSTPRTEMADSYRESVTGIKVPQKKIILV